MIAHYTDTDISTATPTVLGSRAAFVCGGGVLSVARFFV